MLACTGLGNHPFCPQSLGKQRLPDGVVDLVCTGMRKVFAFEPNLGAPALTESRRRTERGWPADPLTQLASKLGLKTVFVQVCLDTCIQSFERRHQRFRNIAAAERAKAPVLIRQFAPDGGLE